MKKYILLFFVAGVILAQVQTIRRGGSGGSGGGNTFETTQFDFDAATNVVVKSGALLTNTLTKFTSIIPSNGDVISFNSGTNTYSTFSTDQFFYNTTINQFVLKGNAKITNILDQGSAYIYVGGDPNSRTNALQLISGYQTAFNSTPNGAVKSSTNRFTIFLKPGNYQLNSGEFGLTNNFIDIKGIGASPGDCFLYSSGTTMTNSSTITDYVLDNFYLHTTTTNATTTSSSFAWKPDVMPSGARYTRLWISSSSQFSAFRSGITCDGYWQDCRTFGVGGSASQNLGFGYGLAGSEAGVASGTFINCESDYAGFGVTFNSTGGATASGTFINCTVSKLSTTGFGFGAGSGVATASGYFQDCKVLSSTGSSVGGFGEGTASTVTASGIFIDCSSNGTGFGHTGTGGSVAATASGKFYNCKTVGAGFARTFNGTTTANGDFYNCQAGSLAFGVGSNGGSASVTGRFFNCISSGVSFGIGTTATISGTFFNCIGGDDSFRGTTISGIFENCIAGLRGFGDAGNAGNTSSGVFINCRASNNSFGYTASGRFVNCTAGTGSFGNAAGAMSGELVSCVLTGKLSAPVSGTIRDMVITATGSNEAAVVLANNGRVIDCILTAGSGTNYTLFASTAITNVISNNRLTGGVGPIHPLIVNQAANYFGDIKLTGGLFLRSDLTNSVMGVVTLIAGTAVVTNSLVTANTRIFLTRQTTTSPVGVISVSARNPGTDFTINSSNGADVDDVAWLLIEPLP